MWTKENLWKLRKEIRLGSLFFSSYRNSFGIDPIKASDFFDGFLEFVKEKMREDHPGFDDKDFWKLLPDYDTPEYLLDWYYCFEEDPLAKDERMKTMKMLEQETPLGTLVARRNAGPNYPGMSIYLRRGEREELLTNVEYDAYKKGIAFHAWFDPQGYGYSHDGVLSENEIKQIFEED